MLRDPRDVVASLQAAGRSWGRSWAPTGVAGAAELWCRFVESALEVESDPRGIVVRYERLLAETAAELGRVCAGPGSRPAPTGVATSPPATASSSAPAPGTPDRSTL